MSLLTDAYTHHVNPYFVAEHYNTVSKTSKHYYMGAQRVATNLGTYEPPISGPGGPSSGFKRQNSTHPLVSNLTDILSELRLDATHEYNVEALITRADYATYHGTTDSAQVHKTEDNTAPAFRLMYWYHPDYLGHVEYITDRDGLPYQYFWYSPWGETLHEQKASSPNGWGTPYKFNGKELDEETGLYYYGARYYNPMVSVWLGVDPLAAQFPHQSPYVFTDNNPIMLWDPTGMSAEDPDGNGLIGQTTFNGISITFDSSSSKSSKDGSDVISQRLMRGTRFEKENDDGTKSMFFMEERIERTATVDIDGNVSSINETYEIKVSDQNGIPVSSDVGSTSYEMNAKDDDGFSAVVGAVQVHRNKYKMAVVPHALKNISNAATFVQDLDFLAAPLYAGCIPCGIVATGVVGSAWLTNKMLDFGFISAKDIRLEIGYMEQKGRAWKGSRKVPFAW